MVGRRSNEPTTLKSSRRAHPRSCKPTVMLYAKYQREVPSPPGRRALAGVGPPARDLEVYQGGSPMPGPDALPGPTSSGCVRCRSAPGRSECRAAPMAAPRRCVRANRRSGGGGGAGWRARGRGSGLMVVKTRVTGGPRDRGPIPMGNGGSVTKRTLADALQAAAEPPSE